MLIAARYSLIDLSADNVQDYFVHKELEMWGFVIFNPIHKPRFQAALKDMSQWIKEVS